ncbi:MAG: MoxR family ATPase [Methylomonas sp.]|jgi:MoxR-like ATPase
MSLTHFTANETIHFPACGAWPESNYLLDERSAYALEMALATQRPLLVKGEPGMGKSFLARAAAAKLNRQFIAEVININTEGQDLLWRFDPVARLNDAHAGMKGDELNPKNYLNPGVLWWAFCSKTAQEQYDVCRHKVYKPQTVNEDARGNGAVLLIDEIDKAEPSLPNSLLEVLGNRGFEVPLLEDSVGYAGHTAPLVIITTNDERELPPAFMRRCLVLHLTVADNDYENWLLERANVHYNDSACGKEIKRLAAQQLIQDREAAAKQGLIKPGLAEYLDLFQALNEMTPANIIGDARMERQEQLLEKIAAFVLKKAV